VERGDETGKADIMRVGVPDERPISVKSRHLVTGSNKVLLISTGRVKLAIRTKIDPGGFDESFSNPAIFAGSVIIIGRVAPPTLQVCMLTAHAIIMLNILLH
jgi:hypothetical protein